MGDGSSSKKKVGDGCGCLGIVFFGIVMWALLFGVTVGDRHYGIGCSTDRGVEVKWGTPVPAETK